MDTPLETRSEDLPETPKSVCNGEQRPPSANQLHHESNNPRLPIRLPPSPASPSLPNSRRSHPYQQPQQQQQQQRQNHHQPIQPPTPPPAPLRILLPRPEPAPFTTREQQSDDDTCRPHPAVETASPLNAANSNNNNKNKKNKTNDTFNPKAPKTQRQRPNEAHPMARRGGQAEAQSANRDNHIHHHQPSDTVAAEDTVDEEMVLAARQLMMLSRQAWEEGW